jgi:hypothetical protein
LTRTYSHSGELGQRLSGSDGSEFVVGGITYLGSSGGSNEVKIGRAGRAEQWKTLLSVFVIDFIRENIAGEVGLTQIFANTEHNASERKERI